MNDHQARLRYALARIEDMDFSLLRMKLSHHEHGHGWPASQVDEAEAQYKQFLALVYAYPDEALVPSQLADEFWHCHILDTRAYLHDCELLFGFTLHHFPYLGMRDRQDAEALEHHYRRTLELHSAHFGATPVLAEGTGSICASCASIDPRNLAR